MSVLNFDILALLASSSIGGAQCLSQNTIFRGAVNKHSADAVPS